MLQQPPFHGSGFRINDCAWPDMLRKCPPLLSIISTSSVRVITLGGSWLCTTESGFGLLKRVIKILRGLETEALGMG